MPTLLDLEGTREATDEIRAVYDAMKHALTEISLYTNKEWGNDASGLDRRGQFNAFDIQKGRFPRRKNVSSQGTLTVRGTHYLAQLVCSIPNTPEECKNVIVRVDRFGGAWRWTGFMHHWSAETIDGVDYVTMTFNSDEQILQFLLCPPNPLLPIPVFQFPRDYFVFSPGCWGAAITFLLNVIRQEGNLWTLPDDPFDPEQWVDSIDPSSWQVHVKCPSFFADSSLWALYASRMNTIDSVLADGLDAGQLVLRHRRVFTDEGEQMSGLIGGVQPANGACVFWIDDESGFGEAGSYFTGVGGGFVRSLLTWLDDGVQSVLSVIDDNEELSPDEYWQNGWMRSLAAAPGLVVRDSYWNDLQSNVTYSPATATQVIVGGDNPTADALVKLMIESVGNLLGYVLLFGFDSLGDIISDVVMPFLVGTIAAWDQIELGNRAGELGWAHLWEIFQSGAEQNSFSLSAVATALGGVTDTEAKTAHTFVLDESTWVMPGLDYDIGTRMGSTSGALQRMGIDITFINQAEEDSLELDDKGSSKYLVKCGQNKAALSRAERDAQMFKKAMDRISDIGVHLIQ